MRIRFGRMAAAIAMVTATYGCTPMARYTGPVIDAHGHLGASFDQEMMVRVMDSNNVSRQVLMARFYPGPTGQDDRPGNDQLSLDLARKYPGRFVPLVGMQRPELTGAEKWVVPDGAVEAILGDTERKLASGRFRGIGEVIVRHFAYSAGRHSELENPVHSPFMQRLSGLAGRFDVPIVLHMEGAPDLVEDFGRLLAEYPAVRYVWAHNCGRSKAPVIRAMLGRYPNLHCDLAGMTNTGRAGYGTGWPRMEDYNALIEHNGVLLPEMRELYDDFPDRFLVGTDLAHAPVMTPENYDQRIERFRVLLGQLKPQAAAAFAEGNAARIFRLDR